MESSDGLRRHPETSHKSRHRNGFACECGGAVPARRRVGPPQDVGYRLDGPAETISPNGIGRRERRRSGGRPLFDPRFLLVCPVCPLAPNSSYRWVPVTPLRDGPAPCHVTTTRWP